MTQNELLTIKKTCSNCAGLVVVWHPYDHRPKCDYTNVIIEDQQSNTCDRWEPGDDLVNQWNAAEAHTLKLENQKLRTYALAIINNSYLSVSDQYIVTDKDAFEKLRLLVDGEYRMLMKAMEESDE